MDTKTLCLGILNRGDATGYEIKKECEEGPFSHFYAAGFGSIYPALNALCKSGHASVQEQPQDKRPDKKVYSITAEGRMALAEAITARPAPDRIRSDFCFILFFCHLLGPRQVDELIDIRVRDLESQIETMTNCRSQHVGPAGERFILGYGAAITEAELTYLKSNRHVLVGELLKGSSPAGNGTDKRQTASAMTSEERSIP